MFFLLQPFGILAQVFAAQALHRFSVMQKLPLVGRRACNFIVVHAWFYFIAPLLIDDLAKGGTFLYEPVPFSVFRLLGLGGKEEAWICWTSPLTWFRWHSADRWWESGLSA